MDLRKRSKIGFAEALDSIVATDPRYQRDAYVFLRDALDYTTKQQKKTKGASVRHVAGPELLEGVRQYALKEFGPMVVTVLSYWGIRSCEDIGHMVFNLIGAGIFGKTEDDSIEDFKNVSDLRETRPTDLENKAVHAVPEIVRVRQTWRDVRDAQRPALERFVGERFCEAAAKNEPDVRVFMRMFGNENAWRMLNLLEGEAGDLAAFQRLRETSSAQPCVRTMTAQHRQRVTP